jgi:hypothetical protein
MMFNISSFSEAFKNAIQWMLSDKLGNEIKQSVDDFKTNKKLINDNQDCIKALALIAELLHTNGRFYKTTDDFKNQLDIYTNKYESDFRSELAINELIKLVGIKHEHKINTLLAYNSIKEFKNNLYQMSLKWKTEVLGHKGRDNFLRDYGEWDRIPIDRHQIRFIIRSGIYHVFGHEKISDPSDNKDLHNIMSAYCFNQFTDYYVESISLQKAPGILDLFIWYYSADDKYEICTAAPKCNKCLLNKACLYSITNQQHHS